MKKFTAAIRQEIIREFAIRHNGHWNPQLFIEEVTNQGRKHPAFEWFEWDKAKAVREHHLWQAREFAQGLKISFTVEKVGRKGPMSVKQVTAPAVLSPVGNRRKGGGYVLTDPGNADHMAEHCRQAAASLSTWLARYSGAVEYAGGSTAAVEKVLSSLTSAGALSEAA